MSVKLKILFLEDNPADIKLLKNELKKGEIEYDSMIVETENDFKIALNDFVPDLILSDYSLPTYNGMQALSYVQTIDQEIPFILITGSLNEETAVNCMKAGAYDYILKDNLKRLIHSIKKALQSKKDKIEKRIALNALRTSEERYRTLFEISPDGILIHNGKIITFANNSAAHMLGYDEPYQLVGMPIYNYVHPLHLTGFREFMRQLENGDYKSTPTEEVFIRADGSILDLEVIAKRFDNSDEFAAMIILRDISERKKTQQELLKAKEKAEQSNNFKTTLMANMSHEFRTPMNGILGFAQILKDELKDDERSKMVQSIIRSSKRLMQTLNSILDLSQIEADKLQARVNFENVYNLILYTTKLYESEFEEKNIQFEIKIFDKHIYANLDEDLFKEIISNLLDNALKFTFEGKVTVSLEKYVDRNGKEWALIKIDDTGIGIAEENTETIFEPFKQLSEGTRRGFEGSGLGLTITKKMVTLMDGKIALESRLNEGSTFLVYFPAVSYKNEDSIGEPIETLPTHHYPSKQLSILLVEDNFINKEVTVLYLKDVCAIDHAPNGEKAVAMANQNLYNIILMDINLGAGIDGIEAMKKIRANSNYKNVPIVALTGYTLREDREKFIEKGFTHYLSKPFEKNDLVDLILTIADEAKKD